MDALDDAQRQALYDDLDDVLSTTSQTMLGLTINCARCHDHKIDPVPQADYYRLLSFFENVQRYGVRGHDTVLRQSTREIATDAERESQQEEVAAHNARVEENRQALVAIEKIATRASNRSNTKSSRRR